MYPSVSYCNIVDTFIGLTYNTSMRIHKKALKALNKMPFRTREKFVKAFKDIEHGETRGMDIRKMQGYEDYMRLRIGDYRAIYTVTDEVVIIYAGPRGDIYK